MKNLDQWILTRALSRGFLVLTCLAPLSPTRLHADGPVAPPLLEIASGLPGRQVRLSWSAQAGVRYAVEKSTTLDNGGAGGWAQVALVKATSTAGIWLDPEPTSTRCFYRIMQPVAEVVSISPPLLSPDGGVLVVEGQSIPPGSSLVLNVDGQLVLVPLTNAGAGLWNAAVTGAFAPGASVTVVGIVDGSGTTIVSLNQPLTVTATGLALDGIPTMPPGAPLAQEQSNPIPGVGIVVKKNPGAPAERMGAGKVSVKDFTFMKEQAKGSGMGSGKVSMSDLSVMRKGYDYYQATSELIAAWGSKKGYDYYKAQSDMSSTGLHNNPAFQENKNVGTMVRTVSNPLYEDNGSGQNPLFERSPKLVREIEYARIKHPELMKREMGNGGNAADFPCLPGEISLQTCSMTLPNPVGPPLQVVHTYRSIGTGGSGTAGSHWDMCYNISIEPVPLAAGANAPRLKIRDGAGRCDMFLRQPDGTYRCDGIFRQGSFAGNVFTLTFADTGKWTFRSLSDRKAPGKISTITSRNGVSLTCDYDAMGQIASVGKGSQTLTFTSSAPGQISRVTDQTGRSVTYSYYGAGDANGNKGDLAAISCPQVNGVPPVAGPTTFTYTTGNADPNLNGNVLSITDGAGRLLESFTYSGETDPLKIDYDTCASHNKTGHVTLNRRAIRPGGGYTVFENDEIGRVTEVDFDRLHRAVSSRSYTGFSTPAVPVTSSTNRPTGKLNATDPDYFEMTCAYNADSLCTRMTCPDGSQKLTTYDRDFRKDCPVVERGNARVTTLRTPGGEERAVRCDFLPGFGTCESINGAAVAGGIAGGVIAGRVASTWKEGNVTGMDDWETSTAHAGGVIAGIVVGAVVAAPDGGDVDDDCDGVSDDFCTRMVTAHGQVYSASYDVQGNCTSVTSPVAGRGSIYGYNALGQCTSMTTLNGSAPSFQDTCSYDPVTHFLSGVTCDSTGLALTTICARDALGRITSITDPVGNNWLYAYNPLQQCVQVQSPPLPGVSPYRIATNITYDMGSLSARCDVEHRGADGTVVATNPAYSTFHVYDSRARLVRVAEEERPVDGSGTLDPGSLGIENFSVCDITLDNAGQCVRLSTPAACRAQPTDRVCDFTYNERGLLDRCIEGGLGNPGAVTTECDYDAVGALVRSATIGSGVVSPETLYTYDGFHRPATTTDPMGNVTLHEYANDGFIITSVYGELDDVPGSVGNVLLSRATARFSSGDLGGTANDPVGLSLPGIGNVCYDLDVKNSAFFTVETEDDTITVERFSPGSSVPPTTEVTIIDRSPAGLVQQITCNGDLLETCSHDTAGRLTGRTYSAGHFLLELNGNGCVTSRTWTALSSLANTPPKTFTVSRVLDPLSRCIQTTDGVGNTARFAFDSLSRVVSETDPGGLVIRTAYDDSSSAGSFSSQVSADFNGDGKPEVLSSSLIRGGDRSRSTDARGYSTFFTNDAFGRLVRCDRPDGTFETTSFDSRGFIVRGTFADSSANDLTCDSNGRVKSVVWSSIPSGVLPVADRTMQYDGLGNLTSCTQGTSVVTATYDSCSDQTSETQNGRTVSRAFNHRGCTGITYPDGKRLQQSRNVFGELVSVSAVSQAGVVLSPPVVSFDYLGHQVCRSVQRNGITTSYSYRGDNEVSPAGPEDFSFGSCVRETITNASSVVLSDKLVSRDVNQRVCTCTEGYSVQSQQKTRLTVTPRDTFGNIAACVISRRDSAALPPVVESSVSYTYDLDGTRLTELRSSLAGEYLKSAVAPSLDQQMGQYSSWPGGNLTWDSNGNIATFQKGANQLTFVHDVEGRVVRVNDSTGHAVVGYGYDAYGRRTEELKESPTTGNLEIIIKFTYDNSVCIQELGTDNIANITFVCADGIRQCISTRNGTIYYPHGGATSDSSEKIQSWVKNCYDKGGLCKIALVTNATGVPVERFGCDESGKPIFLTAEGSPSSATSSAIGLRWLAPECAWEPQLGMYACPGSIYSPDLGRSVSMSVSEAKPQAPRERRGAFPRKSH